MLKSLSDLEVNQTGTIKTIGGEGRLRRRLFDMGITPGASVLLKKKAPMGDPIEITLRGYELTLRKVEAELISVEVK